MSVASLKLHEHIELQIFPRSFMTFQKSDAIVERYIERQKGFEMIDFGMQDILKEDTVRDDIVKSAARMLNRQQVCDLKMRTNPNE